MVHANAGSVIEIKDGSFPRQQFSQGIKQLLSSYTKSINNELGFTGSLFQQKTKAICVTDEWGFFGTTTFHYIHQNPFKAGLVKRMEDWEFSSFRDYVGLRNGTLCNKTLAFDFLDLDATTLYNDSYNLINEESLVKIFGSPTP